MVHYRTRKHRKHQRGGRLDETETVPSQGVADDMHEVPSGEALPPMTGGGRRGRRRGGRRSGRSSSDSSDGGSRRGGRRSGRSSSHSSDGGSRRGGRAGSRSGTGSGRRSRKGGFMANFGAMLKEAVVPIGLSLYTIKNSRRRRGGRDDIA